MAAIPELTIAPNINPSSSTGSDVFSKPVSPSFGAISVGGSGSGASWVSSLVRDLLVAGLSGLAIKYVWGKIK